MTSFQIREQFITFFNTQNHKEVKSASLIPDNDPSLLFTNAGMNPFKNIFLGIEQPKHKRLVSVQKCIRAGGKHNDLDNVGHTARHHTFFEMLGNFSFGDYFKRQAIAWSWQFLTQTLALDKDRLYISVFIKDKETAEIWHKQENIPKDKIFYFGEKDNFWRMGETGPCGPCTEIYYDLGEEHFTGPEHCVGGEGDRFVEIWNLVFMQYFEKDKILSPLQKPCVDTGMGLERLTSILQGKTNNYHTDIFSSLFTSIANLSKKEYIANVNTFKNITERKQQEQINTSFCVLADHIRAVSFLIQDGVMPKSEGRSYVLRRIMRRAIRFAHFLSDKKDLFSSLSASLIDSMESIYPELKIQQQHILNTIQTEETQFLKTLDQGLFLLEKEIQKMSTKNLKILEGKQAFKLYDTYGFPMDLSNLILQEQGLSLDTDGFNKELLKAKTLSKSFALSKKNTNNTMHLRTVCSDILKKYKKTNSLVHSQLECQASIIYLSDGNKTIDVLKAGQEGFFISDKTCVYPEGGGQINDKATGVGLNKDPHLKFVIVDCQKEHDIFVHFVKIQNGVLHKNEKIIITVDKKTRKATEKNHSATHLLHSALKTVLGGHINQAGSLVTEQKLRFDFSHNKALSKNELTLVEQNINQVIHLCFSRLTKTSTYKEAIKNGITALFGEKYAEQVRSVQLSLDSHELCGGTHVSNTGEIQFFKILSESSLSSGIRRIEAVTGDKAIAIANANMAENKSIRQLLNLSLEEDLLQNIKQLKEDNKKLNKKKISTSNIDINNLLQKKEDLSYDNIKFFTIIEQVDSKNKEELKSLADNIRNQLDKVLIILIGTDKELENQNIIVALSKNLNPQLSASVILKNIALKMQGKGGGRADFAQGSVKDIKQLTCIKKEIFNLLV